MNIRNSKITVDVLMTIFLVLSFVRWEGGNGFIFHAVVGIVFALLVVLHLYLNRKWVSAASKSIKEGKANKKIMQIFAIDMILIAVWGIAIVTGFLAIPSFLFGIEFFYVFSRIHAVSSRLGAIFIIIHIFQHAWQIRSYLGMKLKQK